MFVFRKIWRALFSWNIRFEIRLFALLPTNSRMNQVKFVDENRQKYWNDIICLNRPYKLNYFKGCLQQILLCPFLDTLSHMTFCLSACFNLIHTIYISALILLTLKNEKTDYLRQWCVKRYFFWNFDKIIEWFF